MNLSRLMLLKTRFMGPTGVPASKIHLGWQPVYGNLPKSSSVIEDSLIVAVLSDGFPPERTSVVYMDPFASPSESGSIYHRGLSGGRVPSDKSLRNIGEGNRMGQERKLGFLGGTFNPIHNGHVRLAEEAQLQFGLDEVLFIPNHIPPHRSSAAQDLLEGEKRYVMAVLATLSNPHFLVSDLELKRQGVSYTVDTVEELRKKFPDHRIFLICGVDTLIHHTWHRFEDLLNLLDGVLLASRQDENADQLTGTHPCGKLFDEVQGTKVFHRGVSPFKFSQIKMSPIDISSSDIRNRIRGGQEIASLVPKPVKQFIQRYQLYREICVP